MYGSLARQVETRVLLIKDKCQREYAHPLRLPREALP
ncbi:hypothetical protein AVDCRST_MAG81-560 [uncultured Synechococcales cyanobacterium]|uniref:Uncharacterized protein n=1 Tax=uncultured Synechococcales cyanobacterium TaxID=1936017 RepID=A0A6J4UTJ1_9CYAN|nr:hypothetical protein AVDCRST_MAG81-560 [uncultured Synechococcales cyanobacterium]